jgi:Amino acid permease
LSFVALGGFTGALMAWIQAVTIGPIEVEAALGYLQSSFPHIGLEHADATLTGLGILVAAACMAGFTYINILGVRWLAESNSVTMVWKILVPTLTIVVLLIVSFHSKNFTAGGGFARFGAKGIFAALPLGVVFALQGFEQAIQVGGESRNPQRDIHRAVIMAMIIGTILYILLEVAFVGAINPKNVSHNWLNPIPGAGKFGPYATLATSAGVGWLATILYIDAAISPGGTGLVYTGTSARLSYGLGRSGYGPAALGRVDKRGVPRVSLIFCFVVGMLVLLRFPSWSSLVTLVTSATVLMYVRDGARVTRGIASKRSSSRAPLSAARGENPRPVVVRLRELCCVLVGLEHDLLAVPVHHRRLRVLLRLPAFLAPQGQSEDRMARGCLDPALAAGARNHLLPGAVPQLRAKGRLGLQPRADREQTIPFWWDLAAIAAFSLIIYYSAVRFAQARKLVSQAIASVEEEMTVEEADGGPSDDRRRPVPASAQPDARPAPGP